MHSGQLSYFSDIRRAFGAIMYHLEPKGQRGGGVTWTSFTVLILSGGVNPVYDILDSLLTSQVAAGVSQYML